MNVRANNSSLNGILREIARITGMKVTGSVAEQRVFGNYGPDTTSTVLATLLDGTGSNMLFVQTSERSSELVLTPRTGGPSPPSSPTEFPNDASTAPGQVGNSPAFGTDSLVYGRHGQIGAGLPRPPGAVSGGNGFTGVRNTSQPQNGNPNGLSPAASGFPPAASIPSDSLPTPSSVQPLSGSSDSPFPPPLGTTTSAGNGINGVSSDPGTSGNTGAPDPNNPNTAGFPVTGTGANGATTPEQVYQLLQQLRQQSVQQNGKSQ